jgi:hypothetical protein
MKSISLLFLTLILARIIQAHDTIRRSARQWAHELYHLKERKELETGETIAVKQLQQLYQKKTSNTTALSTKSETSSDQCLGVVLNRRECDFKFACLV